MYLSDKFVNHLSAKKMECTAFLVNGVRLSGVITYSDDESIMLTRDGVTQAVFRHAIASIMPQNAFSIHELLKA